MSKQSSLWAASLAAMGSLLVMGSCADDDGGTTGGDTRDAAVPDTSAADSADDSAPDTAEAPADTSVETTPPADNEAEWTWELDGVAVTDYAMTLSEEVTYGGSGVSIELSSRRQETIGIASVGASLRLEDYAGYRVRFTARLKTQGAGNGFIGVATRVGESLHARASTAFASQLTGDNDWTELALELDVDGGSSRLVVSFSLLNAGTVWLDDARVEIVPAEGPDDDLVQRAPVSLDLEGPLAWGDFPVGWQPTGYWELYQLGRDTEVVHGGEASLAIRSDATVSEMEFGSIAQWVHADDFRGKRLRLRVWIKTEGLDYSANVWMRVDGYGGVTAFDNMSNRPIVGTTDWTEHEVVLDVADSSIAFVFGVLQVGNGTTWFDDVTLEEVDESVPVTDLR